MDQSTSQSDICFLPISVVSRLVYEKALSPLELIRAYLERLIEVQETLNAFITITADQALEDARESEREILSGHYRGPLHGIGFALKDVISAVGTPTTLGSKLYANRWPIDDSTIHSRLKAAGAILVGKTNMVQLALGPMGNTDYGEVLNPWRTDRIAGGSSGGSAAATAAGACGFAVGTDTGGSVRLPSSLCNIVGLKPTHGLISRYGVMATSWSLDEPGPLTRTVEDNALVMAAIAGHDPKDSTTSKRSVPRFAGRLDASLKGLRIGVVTEFQEEPIDAEVATCVGTALETLESMGANLVECSWPMYKYSHAISTAILSEATALYSDLTKDEKASLDPTVRLRIESGLFTTAAEYVQAQRARKILIEEGLGLLETVDLLAGPTLPITACIPGAHEVSVGQRRMSPLRAYSMFGRIYNIAGFPAMTVPCGFTSENLPVGLQLGGRPFSEPLLINVGHLYQRNTSWHEKHVTLRVA